MRPQDFRPEDLFTQIGALEKALEAEQRARQDAEAASAAKSRLLATVGREVRSPLEAAVAMADHLLRSELNATQRRHVATMRSAAHGLLSVLRDLLAFESDDADPDATDAGETDVCSDDRMRAGTFGDQLSGRVLIVEDNTINQMLIAAYLDKFGLAYAVATDARQALEALQNDSFDLVLMDVLMPQTDGLQATRHIRALPGGAAGVPVVGLTAKATPGERELCLAAGMNGHVAKPIQGRVLFSMLADYLPPAQTRRAVGA